MLSLRLPLDIEQRLEALATATGCSKSWHAREAIVGYLEDMEVALLAARELEEIRAGRAETVALKEVMERYGTTV